MEKICNKCGELKIINKGNICLLCKRIAKKEYYVKNKEHILSAHKERWEKNKDIIYDKFKIYYREHKDIIKEKQKTYKENNKKKLKDNDKKYYENNKEEILSKLKNKYEKNKEFIKDKSIRYYYENRDIILSKRKGYYDNNKNTEKYKKWKRDYIIKKRKKYPHIFAWRNILRYSLSRLGKKKEGHTIDLLGYSATELKEHIEKQFTENMTWNNYGEWEIDHIREVCTFDKDTPINIVNALNNLQPLWRKDNYNKWIELKRKLKQV